MKNLLLILTLVLVGQSVWAYETRVVDHFEVTNGPGHKTGDSDAELQTRLVITADDQAFHLQLKPAELVENTRIIDDTSITRNFSVYQGVVENYPESWARITLLDDQLFGLIDLGDSRFQVSTDPLDATSERNKVSKSFFAPLEQQLRNSKSSVQLMWRC